MGVNFQRRAAVAWRASSRKIHIHLWLLSYWLPIASVLLLSPLVEEVSSQQNVLQIGRFFSGVGYDLYILISLLVLHGWARQWPRRKALWWSLDIILCTTLCVHLLKVTTHLPRPSGSPSGFPSGHTTFAFALAGLMLETRPRLAPLWFAFAIAVGWSRVEVHAHYPYQVLVGSVLGFLLSRWIICQSGGVLVPRCFGWKRRIVPAEVQL